MFLLMSFILSEIKKHNYQLVYIPDLINLSMQVHVTYSTICATDMNPDLNQTWNIVLGEW